MALNCADTVERLSRAADEAPASDYRRSALDGELQRTAAHMAVCMAAVSLAEDVHRIADALGGGDGRGPA